MANRVGVAPVEPASVKDETCKAKEDTHQSAELTVNSVAIVDCSGTGKVPLKQNMDGNGHGKSVGQSKDVAVAGGKGAKSPDNEVFIPAPPPATNAWTKRMQASASSAKSAAESACADDRPKNAQLHAGSNEAPPAQTRLPNPSPAVCFARSDSRSARLRLEGSEQIGSGGVAADVSKQPIVEHTDNPSSSKQIVDSPPEVRSKSVSEGLSKAEVHAGAGKSVLPATAAGPSGCWNKSVAGTAGGTPASDVDSAGETSVARGSSPVKHHSAGPSTGTASTEEPRRWETNAGSSQSSSANENSSESAGLNDSANWPSLNKAAEKAPASEPSPAVLPSATTTNDAVSEEKTSAVVENHVPRLSDSSNDKCLTKESASKDSAAENKSQSAKKKGKGNKPKWLPYEIELPKTRRRPVAGRPRGSNQDQSRAMPESVRESRDGPRDAREAGRRREGRGGGTTGSAGGRESTERTATSVRRNRREPGEKPVRSPQDHEVDDSKAEASVETTRADRAGQDGTGSGASTSRNIAAVSPAHVGYQGSRRSVNRGRASYRTRGTRYQPVWGAPTFQYLGFGPFDPTQQYYCHIETPTFYTPIVSQSDYYTSVLADDAAKKLIAQQIEYYLSDENLTKDFFLRRQMDADGWIPVELLASFRRVRIHTGAVNTQLIVESLAGSKTVEISEDKKHMRTRNEPGKWSLTGVEPGSFSSLNASVPEFVPGKLFQVPMSGSQDLEHPRQMSKDPVAEGPAAEVSSRLEEMAVSEGTGADQDQIRDASTDVATDHTDDVGDDKDVNARLSFLPDDTQRERCETTTSSSLPISHESRQLISETEASCSDEPSSPPASDIAPDTVGGDTDEDGDKTDISASEATTADLKV